MRIIKSILLLLILPFISCNSNNSFTKAENALDAGREFIDGFLTGNFDKATFFMLNDSINVKYLLIQKKIYNPKSNEEKKQLKESSIIINEESIINDSIHIINFKNSFDKVPRVIKVILRNKEWKVDLKYSFNGNL